MRSSLLYAIELISGERYNSMKELREVYPHLPRPLPLNVLAAEIEVLADDLMAWEKYKARSPGAPRRAGSDRAIAKAQKLRDKGKSLRAIGLAVGRSRTWVQTNTQ
jgi:hypothetical protein